MAIPMDRKIVITLVILVVIGAMSLLFFKKQPGSKKLQEKRVVLDETFKLAQGAGIAEGEDHALLPAENLSVSFLRTRLDDKEVRSYEVELNKGAEKATFFLNEDNDRARFRNYIVWFGGVEKGFRSMLMEIGGASEGFDVDIITLMVTPYSIPDNQTLETMESPY